MKYILSLFAVCFLSSCDKNENKEPSRTELITSSAWKYDNGGVDQDKNGTVDVSFATLGILDPCALDNTATFNSNGTGTTAEGALLCNPSTAGSFTWSFANNETALNIAGNVLGLGGQFKITALTGTNFSLSKDTTITVGVPLNVSLIVNLKH